MNKLIKELAEQCWVECKYGPAWFNQEKFAELIIAKCAELTHWEDYEMSKEQRIRLDVYNEIKQYFGIKE